MNRVQELIRIADKVVNWSDVEQVELYGTKMVVHVQGLPALTMELHSIEGVQKQFEFIAKQFSGASLLEKKTESVQRPIVPRTLRYRPELPHTFCNN